MYTWKVKTIVEVSIRGTMPAGQLEAHFNARDVPGGNRASRLTTPKISITKISKAWLSDSGIKWINYDSALDLVIRLTLSNTVRLLVTLQH